MKGKFRNNKKGMSIIISTVIIIAISITMAIAVAFWAMGVGNSFTKFEKLEFVSIYADLPTNVYFSAGTQATATVTTINGGQVDDPITVTNGGTGYSSQSSPEVFFNGGGGSGAVANATVNNGRVISITVTNGGSGYTSPPTIKIDAPLGTTRFCFPVYIQLKNTGSAAATINNVFLNGKPYSAYTYMSQNNAQNLVGTVLNVGVRNNNLRINLPTSTGTWSSGDYVEIEIETSAGRLYSNTVLLP